MRPGHPGKEILGDVSQRRRGAVGGLVDACVPRSVRRVMSV
jgi:hypothetical protein